MKTLNNITIERTTPSNIRAVINGIKILIPTAWVQEWDNKSITFCTMVQKLEILKMI